MIRCCDGCHHFVTHREGGPAPPHGVCEAPLPQWLQGLALAFGEHERTMLNTDGAECPTYKPTPP